VARFLRRSVYSTRQESEMLRSHKLCAMMKSDEAARRIAVRALWAGSLLSSL